MSKLVNNFNTGEFSSEDSSFKVQNEPSFSGVHSNPSEIQDEFGSIEMRQEFAGDTPPWEGAYNEDEFKSWREELEPAPCKELPLCKEPAPQKEQSSHASQRDRLYSLDDWTIPATGDFQTEDEDKSSYNKEESSIVSDDIIRTLKKLICKASENPTDSIAPYANVNTRQSYKSQMEKLNKLPDYPEWMEKAAVIQYLQYYYSILRLRNSKKASLELLLTVVQRLIENGFDDIPAYPLELFVRSIERKAASGQKWMIPKDAYIPNQLHLTPRVISLAGYEKAIYKVSHQKKAQEHWDKNLEGDMQILECLKRINAGEHMTYEEIAQKTGWGCAQKVNYRIRRFEKGAQRLHKEVLELTREDFVNNPKAFSKTEKKLNQKLTAVTVGDIIEDIDEIPENDDNLLILGEAGTGKSELVKKYIQSTDKRCLTVSFTGLAVTVINGQTIHSTFRLERTPFVKYKKKQSVINELAGYDVLIIDEISTVRADLFSVMMRYVAEAERQRGGKRIRIIATGDFSQLPPFIGSNDKKVKEQFAKVYGRHYRFYCFYAPEWKDCNWKIYHKKKVWRQDDPEVIESLKMVYRNNEAGLDLFNLKVAPEKMFDKNAFHVCALRKEARLVNNTILGKCKSKPCYTVIEAEHTEGLNELDFEAWFNLPVFQGMRVMFIQNNRKDGYMNGMIGHITKINTETGVIEVLIKKGDSGRKVRVTKALITSTENEEVDESVSPDTEPKHRTSNTEKSLIQYPFVPAYAVTMHKIQGQTIKNKDVVIHPTGIFASGQLYVALSRATSIDQLFLTQELQGDMLIPNAEVEEFYQSIGLKI